MEVNASDTRNKADKGAKTGVAGKLSNQIKVLVGNTALGTAADGTKKRVCPAALLHFTRRSPHLCLAAAGSAAKVVGPVRQF